MQYDRELILVLTIKLCSGFSKTQNDYSHWLHPGNQKHTETNNKESLREKSNSFWASYRYDSLLSYSH